MKLFSLLSLLFLFSNIFSQTTNFSDYDNQIVADDSTIRVGTFANGLKYYVKNNKKPNNKVELRLIIKVGSIVEDENQQGLAHFMEHMCFNGTKHFKKNEIVNYLQKKGVKFGAHVNASTGFDKTIYKLSIPSKEKKELEKGFQILEDWAFNVLLTTEEIDKERGVVLEEYRSRLSAQQRLRKKYYPKYMYNSRYSKRFPIGKKDIIENFDLEVLRKFYNDWYRPDLMAVIAVGDVDVDILEAKVKAHFDKKNKVENPRERKYYGDDNHKETLVSIEADNEVIYNKVRIIYKFNEKIEVANKIIDWKKYLPKQLFQTMINNRLSEIKNKNNPPFLNASAKKIILPSRKYAYQCYATVKDNDYLLALKTLLVENERAKRYGFTEEELERAKKTVLANINSRYDNKDEKYSSSYLNPIINNFLHNDEMPCIEWIHDFYIKEIPKVTLVQVNAVIGSYLRKDNRVVIVTGKEKTVTEKEILALISSVENDETLKPYVENKTKKSLFTELPKKGKIVNEETDYGVKVTTLTLSNGVKVHYRKTDYKDKQVLFECRSKGGTSLMSTKDYLNIVWALNWVKSAGIAGFDKNDLKKYLTAKKVFLKPYISEKIEGMTGNSTPKDLETLFQLIHLYFTQINKDKEAFETYISKLKTSYENALSSPLYYFKTEFKKYRYGKHNRFVGFPTEEDFNNTDYELAYKLYNERFENAADFNFVFVGNFEEDTIKKYAEIYLASLPAKNERENFIDDGFYPLSGNHTKTFYKGKEDKAYVQMKYRGKHEYSIENKLALTVIKEILSIKLVEELREEKSGIYSPSVSSYFSQSNNSYGLTFGFSCDPKNTDELIGLAKAEVERIIEKGPTKKDLDKAKEYLKKSGKFSLKSNYLWLNLIAEYTFYNKSYREFRKYSDNVNEFSTKDIKNLSKELFSNGAVVGILKPESFKK